MSAPEKNEKRKIVIFYRPDFFVSTYVFIRTIDALFIENTIEPSSVETGPPCPEAFPNRSPRRGCPHSSVKGVLSALCSMKECNASR